MHFSNSHSPCVCLPPAETLARRRETRCLLPATRFWRHQLFRRGPFKINLCTTIIATRPHCADAASALISRPCSMGAAHRFDVRPTADLSFLDPSSKYANTVAGCASRHSNTPPPAPRKKPTGARRRSTEKTEPSGPKIPRSRFPARSHPPPEASHVVSNASIRCDAIDAFCRIVASPHRCARVNKLATSSPRKGSWLAPHARAPLTPVIRAL